VVEPDSVWSGRNVPRTGSFDPPAFRPASRSSRVFSVNTYVPGFRPHAAAGSFAFPRLTLVGRHGPKSPSLVRACFFDMAPSLRCLEWSIFYRRSWGVSSRGPVVGIRSRFFSFGDLSISLDLLQGAILPPSVLSKALSRLRIAEAGPCRHRLRAGSV